MNLISSQTVVFSAHATNCDRLHGADGRAVTRAIDRDRDDCSRIHDRHCSSTSNLQADLQKVALSGHSGAYNGPHRFDESG